MNRGARINLDLGATFMDFLKQLKAKLSMPNWHRAFNYTSLNNFVVLSWLRRANTSHPRSACLPACLLQNSALASNSLTGQRASTRHPRTPDADWPPVDTEYAAFNSASHSHAPSWLVTRQSAQQRLFNLGALWVLGCAHGCWRFQKLPSHASTDEGWSPCSTFSSAFCSPLGCLPHPYWFSAHIIYMFNFVLHEDSSFGFGCDIARRSLKWYVP